MVHVSSKYGQLYQCSVPYNQVMNEESKEKGRDHREKGQESVSEILDNNLKRECFYYVSMQFLAFFRHVSIDLVFLFHFLRKERQ